MPYSSALQVALVLCFFAFVSLKIAAQRSRGVRAVILRNLREKLLVGLFFAWFGATLVHALGLAPILGEPRWFESPALEIAGATCAVGGLVLFGAALMRMGRNWHIGIDEEADDALVTDGVFAWSRHPIYVCVDLVALGVFLLNGSPFFGISALCIVVGVHMRMLEEERYLMTTHPDAYAAYRARVGRYFGSAA